MKIRKAKENYFKDFKEKIMKKIIIPFEIDQNAAFVLSEKNRDKIKNFKKKNSLTSGEMTLEIAEGPEYWQHKHYRSKWLLGAITEAMGYVDEFGNMKDDFVHEFIIKPKFCFCPISDVSEIPERHWKQKKKCRIVVKEIYGVEKVVGYIPSCANFTYDEMKNFILECEALRDSLPGWSVGEEDAARMMEMRAKAFPKDGGAK